MRMPPFRSILASLTRHKLVAILLLLQVAATCAIVCNVGFMVATRVQRMYASSGIDEASLVLISAQDFQLRSDVQQRHEADLARLRMIPGVTAAVVVDSMPFSRSTWRVGSRPAGSASDAAGGIPLTLYSGTPGELTTLGIRLIGGHDFAATDYRPMRVKDNWAGLDDVDALIVSRAVAEHYFPGRSAVGRAIRIDEHDRRIVGVFDHLATPSPGSQQKPDYTVLTPMLPDDSQAFYVVRCAPAECDRVGQRASDLLQAAAHDRLLKPPQHFSEMRATYFRRDLTMVGLLIASGLGLLFVTALGITGLANFWVQQRTRSIGIRRAVGATRGDILRYFQTENFLIVGAGIVLGMLLAFVLNAVLMTHYELPRLPLFYLPVGALILWLLGQLAVLGPALRAAAVPPVVATRSV
ncbi:ABC transporter permease [Rhodanobacter sp. Col0626]|uniref:ABC transporter permease n=1 Tax=Rhodanobacter sp. Col0626 TaxID=3415679 RepID=UPI003CE961CC